MRLSIFPHRLIAAPDANDLPGFKFRYPLSFQGGAFLFAAVVAVLFFWAIDFHRSPIDHHFHAQPD